MEELHPYILLISKPFGITSFKFTEKVRKTVGAKRAGHTGTLDPMATGLMVIALNGATRFIQFIDTNIKEYVIQIEFGIETDTDDITGNVINTGKKFPELKEIESTLKGFLGKFEQLPPRYSAKKINGKELYKYARSGEKAEIKPVEVEIYNIDILFFKENKLVLRVLCSKGTYMRTLARDLGRKLGTYATLSAIARTRVGRFSIKDATFLSCVERGIRKGFVELKDAIQLPTFTAEDRGKFLNGVDIETNFVKFLDQEGNFLGVGEILKGKIHPKKVLNEDI